MQRFIMTALIALAACAAQGQVVRCTNPATGHTTYSDRPCDSGHPGKLVEQRRSQEEIALERRQAEQANQRKRQDQLNEAQSRQAVSQSLPAVAQQVSVDKSASYECRQARKDHETVSSIRTGTTEERRNRINSSTLSVNAACGLSTELIQPPARRPIIDNRSVGRPANFTRCDAGVCYDNLGVVYHRQGPGFMTGPNGQACHKSGATWVCN